MKLPEGAGYVLAFAAGVGSVYIIARIMAPSISLKIANGVTDEVMRVQSNTIGATIAPRNEVFARVGVPIGNQVMSSMYLQ